MEAVGGGDWEPLKDGSRFAQALLKFIGTLEK
jgi:hypothetical protein